MSCEGVTVPPAQEGAVSLLRFSPDESVLVAVSGGGAVCLWELNLLSNQVPKVRGGDGGRKEGGGEREERER